MSRSDSPGLIPESFSADERKRLFEICNDIYFVDKLETLRAEYACTKNNMRILTLESKRREGLAGQRVDWALNQPIYDKPPSEADIRKTMCSIEEHANKLLDDLRRCGHIEISALHDAGLTEPDLLTRVIDDLEALTKSSEQALDSGNFRAFPRDHKGLAVIKAMRGVARVFRQFDLTVSDYHPRHDGRCGPFWSAVVIVLSHEPHRRQWRKLFPGQLAQKKSKMDR